MLAPLPRADGVQYRILAPYGLTVFDCPSLRATLQPSACAANWFAHRDGSRCLGCPTGAIHAGKPPSTVQKLPPNSRTLPCCRCGQKPTYRLIGGVFCPSCDNRNREILKGFNSKGKPPWQTAEKLREVWAIIAVPGAKSALDELFSKKSSSDTGFAHRLKIEHMPGLPFLSVLDSGNLWINAIVSGQDELSRIVSRLLPGAEISDTEFSPSFAERWRSSP